MSAAKHAQIELVSVPLETLRDVIAAGCIYLYHPAFTKE